MRVRSVKYKQIQMTMTDNYLYKSILIASHRRSGTHWTIDSIRHNFPSVSQKFIMLDRILPSHPKPMSLNEFKFALNNSTDKVILKTHLTPFEVEAIADSNLRQMIQSVFDQSKIIYVLRDGRDVLTSLFYYVKSIHKNAQEVSFTQFLTQNIGSHNIVKQNFEKNNKTNINRIEYWKLHVESWLSQSNDIYVLRYEALAQEFNKILQELENYLEIPINRKIFKPELKAKGSSAVLPRKGVVGDYKQLFSEDDLAFFDRIAGELVKDWNMSKYMISDFNRGNQLQRKRKFKEAIVAYNKSIEFNPNFSWSHHNLGQALAHIGKHEDAVNSHRRAIELNPFSALSRYNLAKVLTEIGQLNEAISLYHDAININPNCAWYYYDLAETLTLVGNFKEALVAFSQAVKLNPNFEHSTHKLDLINKWNTAKINNLKQKYIFPDVDGIESFYFSLDGGGRELIIDTLENNSVDLMIEIGCFLCGSTIQWLESRKSLIVVGIDPWKGNFASTLERYDGNPVFKACFSKIKDRAAFIQSVREHGPYMSALANVQTYKDRFIPVQAYSPEVLYEIYDIGIKPQLIFFDSDKVLNNLEVCYELFPDAILSGDDWTWGADRGFPVQKKVNEFCQRHGFSVTVKQATWILK